MQKHRARRDDSKIGPWIRRLRHERHMTLAQVSKKSGLDASLISRLERGQKKATARDVIGISKAFDIDEQEILRHGSSPKPKAVS
jgi:transcriptional regulator with XRE-family HTH domain